MPPESSENLHIFFAPESSRTGTKSDQQVFIIPFNEDLPDQKVDEMEMLSDRNISEISLAADIEQVKPTEIDGLKQESTESHEDPVESETASENNQPTEDVIHPEEAGDEEGKSAQDIQLDGDLCDEEQTASHAIPVKKDKERAESDQGNIKKSEMEVDCKNNDALKDADGNREKPSRCGEEEVRKEECRESINKAISDGDEEKRDGTKPKIELPGTNKNTVAKAGEEVKKKEGQQSKPDEVTIKVGIEAANDENKKPVNPCRTSTGLDNETPYTEDIKQKPAESTISAPKLERVGENSKTKENVGITAQHDENEKKTGGYDERNNGSDRAKEKGPPVPKKDTSQPEIPALKIKAKKKMKKFLSEAHCADIVNKNNATFTENCLKVCDIQVPEKRQAVENRTELLEFIQAVKEGTTKAPKALISLMVSKLSSSGVEEELQRMNILVPKSKKAKDKMKLVEEYLLQVHHGNNTDTPNYLPPPNGYQTSQNNVDNHTSKYIPPLLPDGQSDTTSDDEDWSDSQPPIKDSTIKKPKRGTKSRKRCSLNTRHGAAKATVSRKKEVKLKTSAMNETGFSKQDEVEMLKTALNMLQAKFVEQVEEHKKLMESIIQAHQEEKLKCEKLEKELLSQKHCLEIMLQESTSVNKKPQKREATNPHVNQEIKLLKTDVDNLKSSLKDLVQQKIDKNLENVNKRLDKNQIGLEKLRAAHKKREKEPVAQEKSQQVNGMEHELPRAQAMYGYSEPDQGIPRCHNVKNRGHVRESAQPVAVNIIIKTEETEGSETFLPLMDKCGNGKLDINVNVKKSILNTSPKTKDPSDSHIPSTGKVTKRDDSKATSSCTSSKTNSTVGPGNDTSLSWTQPPNTVQRKETVKLTDHSKPPTGPIDDQAEVPLEGPTSTREKTEESEEPGRDSYRRNDKSSHRSSGNTRRQNGFNRGATTLKKDEAGGVDNVSATKLYQRRKCLLIHDSTFEGFSQEYFSNQFDVTTFSVKKASIAAQSQRLRDVITQKAPECIYVHLGLHDIISTSVDNTLCHFEELKDYLVHSTKASICFSLVVPTTNSPTLNAKINELNKELSLMISTARHDNASLQDYLFTYDNSSVGWLNEKRDQHVELTKRGKMVMWTKLNDGLRKTLRLPRPSLSQKHSSNSHQNRMQYR